MIIGIASRCIIENQVRKEFVNEEYINLLKKYGLTPLILPYNLSSYKELFSLCDLFCLPGGGDIDAKYYNSINEYHNKLVYKDVDKLDFLILKYAIKKRKPVLGICRGLQVINVFFKGDLIQHIEDDLHLNQTNHQLEIENHSIFKDKIKELTINSYHHQKIGKIGEGIIVDGICKDAIEIIRHKDYPIIATQYHLEKIDNSTTDLIMKYFINLSFI